ncbi:MAG: PQQ-binding-like beta-propeller repeat protein [Prevotellaceae bacterium]|nr:PQQ-binding-like beta-propeller repeat protein [Prevotellaceae bacterium]
MMKNKLVTLLCPTTVVCFFMEALFASCGQSQRVDNSVDTLADSVVAERRELPLYPDTALPSASRVSADITVFDTLATGRLASVESLYDGKQGWFTFRGNNLRNADYGGKVKGVPSKVVVDWKFLTDFDSSPTSMGTWGGGTGWTGQPLYVNWTSSQVEAFRKQSPGLTPDFTNQEIIVASLCGRVYFLNFTNGRESRKSIDVTNPIKGTCSLDPSMNGNLYVGQGIPKETPVGQVGINLFSHSRTFFSGADRKAWRGWVAYDSSPLAIGGYLFWPGENGTIYKYTITDNALSLHSTLRYRCKGVAPGVENSMCAYNNYGWFGDNRGNIICIELNTLKPVWHYDNHDDIDGSPVCEVEGDVPYIYVGCEVDKQGDNGICYFVKLNGLTGQKVWEQQIECRKLNLGGKHFDGGLYCTPLLGKGDCSNLIFANICQRNTSANAEFTAFDKSTGEVVYRVALNSFAWSSPVAFYNENNQMFVFTGDSSGFAYLIEAKTGKVLFKQHMVNNFESSPVVVDNHLVVGSRGREIYRFSVE